MVKDGAPPEQSARAHICDKICQRTSSTLKECLSQTAPCVALKMLLFGASVSRP